MKPDDSPETAARVTLGGEHQSWAERFALGLFIAVPFIAFVVAVAAATADGPATGPERRRSLLARWGRLLEAGVRIYLYPAPAVLHSKHFSIDDDVAVIGSSNMDMRSFALNYEISLMMLGREVVSAMRETVASTRRSDEMSLAMNAKCCRSRCVRPATPRIPCLSRLSTISASTCSGPSSSSTRRFRRISVPSTPSTPGAIPRPRRWSMTASDARPA